MPTVCRQKNPYSVGEVVTMLNLNGTGEGILWRVTQVRGSKVRLSVCLCVTGPSVLRDKTVMSYQVKPADLVALCSARAQLDNLIHDIVINRSEGDVGPTSQDG